MIEIWGLFDGFICERNDTVIRNEVGRQKPKGGGAFLLMGLDYWALINQPLVDINELRKVIV